MQSLVYAIWGCMYELNSSTYNCTNSADMSNAVSTWVGIAIGGLIKREQRSQSR